MRIKLVEGPILMSALIVLCVTACSKAENEKAPEGTHAGGAKKVTSLAPVSPGAAIPGMKAPSGTQDTTAQKQYTDHVVFWNDFQESVASNNAERVAAFVDFPFRTRDSMDSESDRQHDRGSFIAMWQGWVSTDPGLTVDPTTMAKMVASTMSIPQAALDMNQGIVFRIGNFEFRKKDSGWHLDTAYTADLDP